jgi:hypothetical protein
MKNDYEPKDIRGVWVAITNDSVYEEVIITEKYFFLYGNSGDFLLTYKMKNDSLELFLADRLQSKGKFKRISEDAFLERSAKFEVEFNRLNDFVDTAKVLSIKMARYFDEEYNSKYGNEMRQRRHEWDSTRNASR